MLATRRFKRTLGWLASALAIVVAARAADEPHPKVAPNTPPYSDTVGGVYDALGNPVDLPSSAAGPKPAAAEPPADGRVVKRGRDWWPYAGALPPFGPPPAAVESMAAGQIQVNGVVTLDISNVKGSLQGVPKDLILDAGAQANEREGYYLVKLEGLSRTQVQVDALQAAGAVLGEYLNVNTYIAKIAAGSVAAVRSLSFVTYVGDYQPAYKLSPRLGLEDVPIDEAIDSATGRSLPWLLAVTLHKGASLDDAVAQLDRLGILPEARSIVTNDTMTVVYVKTIPDAIPLLAKIPGVKWIEEKPYARLLASATSPATIPMLLQNNAVFTTSTALGWPLWNAGIDGTSTGQIITMMDSGLNTSVEHMAQDTSTAGTLGPAHRKVVGYDDYGGDTCVLNYTTTDGGHGTWTSEHAAGSISSMTTNPDVTHTPTQNYDLGIARGAKIYFQDVGTSAGTLNTPADLGPSITAAIGSGSFVQNYSWGTSSPTYDAQTSSLDTALFNNPSFVVTVAAGNSGTAGSSTVGTPSTSKNGITVGGVDAANPDHLFEDCNGDGVPACGGANDLGSARGPVSSSLRVKPDILTYFAFTAPVGGEKEAGNRPYAMCQSDAVKTVYWDFVNTNSFGGTSFAAPEAAGLAALVRDYFQQGFYPTGVATPANALTATGALVKAVILASGEDISNTASPSSSIALAKRYSNDVGYGRANLPAVLHLGAAAPFLWVQNGDSLGDGSTKSFLYNVNDNDRPLRVMMVYYDAAGNALQADADLKVTIGGNVYWGNNFSGGWSTSATSTRDHTNPTEGVFLDAAHGLPASGTVQVDVIGFNDPGGMTYSLAVVGDVASTAVTQVSLDKSKYTCSDTIKVTVNDAVATSPVQVTLVSKNSSSTTIDTQIVNCTGSGGVFQGTIVAGSGIQVANGGTITANYAGAAPATSNVSCQAAVADGGSVISGGCDNAAAGTDPVNGPLSNGGTNEFYTKYMDAGETSAYQFGFTNQTGATLTDVTVTLSFSGAGAANMSVFNNPIHVGKVNAGALAGATFQVATDALAAGLSPVNMQFDITSPADGYTAPSRITQARLLQANDVISRQNRCSTFNGSIAGFTDTPVGGHPLSGWKWSGTATTPSTIGSENRTDGICSNSTANAAAMIGNSLTTAGNNFTANSDSVLATVFQPALQGNGPSGQPYHYAWKWHSFYHASETPGTTTGVWGVFYNDQWNSATTPTGDQVTAFPINISYFYQTIFDYVGTWNWDAANTGTPDNPSLTSSTIPPAAPNQLFITFTSVTGLATPSTWFAYGQEHADVTVFGGTSTATTRRDVAFDNDNLVYDEYYAVAQAGVSCNSGNQVGQVAFDLYSYTSCPASSATVSVIDQNASGPITVTVTSPGTGDSEVITLTGAGPYYSGTVGTSTQAGRGANNGTLFVLPNETITASYTDTAPAGTSTATALVACTGGDVQYVSSAQVSDNGDNDGFADNNETVTMDITVKNNLAAALTNAKVTIFSDSPNVDCIPDNQALYGTIAPGGTATNPPGDRFSFHVAPSVACSDWQNPPTARFTVVITGDGLDGPQALQTFSISLDLDSSNGSYTYTQAFASDPGWAVGVTAPDNTGCTGNTYTNNFHWCAACGNAGGGYGAWIGNNAFGTNGQNYTSVYNSSTLTSPTFIANGATTLQFDVAYRTEPAFDGALVQYSLNGGAWARLAYSTPAQSPTTSQNFCSPILFSTPAWTGTGVSWTTTNAASVPSTSGQTLQFRWRLGGDISGNGTTYGGLGVDNVTITNLRQTVICEPTRNTVSASNGGTICEGATLNLSATFLPGATYSWTGPNGFTSSQQNPSIPNAPAAAGGLYTVTVMVNGCSTVAGQASTSATVMPNGTSCNDGNACTSGDACTGGACAGTPLNCNDNNFCTSDSCNPATGCIYVNNTNPCNDGNACTSGDTCGGGTCNGTPIVCNDGNGCTDDSCNPATGCVFTNNTAPCNDGNACTSGDTCGGGTCHPGGSTNCNDNNPCTKDTCNPATGCAHTNNTAPCDDGNLCTTGDVCGGGTCHGGAAVICDDENDCTTDSCNPATGCVYTNNTNPCDDGNACTTGDVCGGGTCHPGAPAACNDNNVCTNDSCNPATGCVHTNNAASCDDGNACTTGDVCGGGTCHAGAPVVCDDGNVCTTDSCDPATGCVYNPVACDDGNPCTDDSCDPQAGCQHTNNTASCDDGNACTTGDVCGGGSCQGGLPVVCNDGNVCTDDVCIPATGCVYVANTASCDDGNDCTQGDTCSGGTCSGTPVAPPDEAGDLIVDKSGDTANVSWTMAPGAIRSDVLRGSLSGLPVGPGGADESCFDDLPGTTFDDPQVPGADTGWWYLVRGESVCGNGTWGFAFIEGLPGSERTSTTCP